VEESESSTSDGVVEEDGEKDGERVKGMGKKMSKE
jgi:hypothetical protein